MTTATKLIERSLSSIGANSPVNPVDPSIIEACLPVLVAELAYLAKKEIVLAETVSDVTTTIAIPTTLASELDEPQGAYQMLIDRLLPKFAPLCRIPVTIEMQAGAQKAIHNLYNGWGVSTIPDKIPSRLLPLGEGNTGSGKARFFSGQTLDDDSE